MATDNWQDQGDNWTTDADWSTGARPGLTDDVVIAQGSPKVTTDVGTVNSVMVSGFTFPTITGGGRLTTTNDFSVVSQGSFFVQTSLSDTLNATLNVGGALNNTNGLLQVGGQSTTSATITVNGASTNNGAVSINNYGVVNAMGGFTQTTIQNNGAQTINHGTLNTSNLSLNANSQYNESLDGSTTGTFGQAFATGNVTLGATFNLDIGNFVPTTGQQFDIIHNSGANPVSGTFAGLGEGATFTANNASITFSITYHGGASGKDVVLTDVGAVCFASGTLIRTVRGDVAVEVLAVGDILVTASGETRPVKWIGRQTVASAFADPIRSFPIRVAAGAIDTGVPTRDLYLSPDHALVIENVLVQAGALVNGTSITRVQKPEPRFT